MAVGKVKPSYPREDASAYAQIRGSERAVLPASNGHPKAIGIPDDRYADARSPDYLALPELWARCPRKREVHQLHVQGFSRQQIAARLEVSGNTVRNHVHAIYDMLGVSNRVQALRWAPGQPSFSALIFGRSSDPKSPLDSWRDVRRVDDEEATVAFQVIRAIRFFRNLAMEMPPDGMVICPECGTLFEHSPPLTPPAIFRAAPHAEPSCGKRPLPYLPTRSVRLQQSPDKKCVNSLTGTSQTARR